MSSQEFVNYIAALDIGSSKISAMIAGMAEDGRIVVLGTGQRASAGIKRGYIVDVARAQQIVREAVEQAERLAGFNIKQIMVNYGAAAITSRFASVDIGLTGDVIVEEDLEYLHMKGYDMLDADGQYILHAQPTLYTLDGGISVPKPLGLHAENMSVEIHMVCCDGAPVRNMELAVRSAHLGISNIVASPLAAGSCVLDSEEMDMGVALVDIGSAVTNIGLYAGGVVVGLKSINFGGGDITDAIASAFGLRRNVAERIKCLHGAATSSPRDTHDMIDVRSPDEDSRLMHLDKDDDGHNISRASLVSVIRQPLNDLLEEIERELTAMGFGKGGRHRIVLTGGGADLRGLADHMQASWGNMVRIGLPKGLEGIPQSCKSPAFASVAGLLIYARDNPTDIQSYIPGIKTGKDGGKSGGLGRIWRSLVRNF